MSLKRAVSLIPFFLVFGSLLWASPLLFSITTASGFDFVRISDSSGIQLNGETSFKTGVHISDNTVLFASAGLSLSSLKICFNTFRTPGDVSYAIFRLGIQRNINDLSLAAGAGLDLMFASSYVKRTLLLLGISAGATVPFKVYENMALSIKTGVSFSFARDLNRFAVNVGLSVTGGQQ